jgi:hypothetical protein
MSSFKAPAYSESLIFWIEKIVKTNEISLAPQVAMLQNSIKLKWKTRNPEETFGIDSNSQQIRLWKIKDESDVHLNHPLSPEDFEFMLSFINSNLF